MKKCSDVNCIDELNTLSRNKANLCLGSGGLAIIAAGFSVSSSSVLVFSFHFLTDLSASMGIVNFNSEAFQYNIQGNLPVLPDFLILTNA